MPANVARIVLGIVLVLAAARGVTRAARIGNCPGGRFVPDLSTAAGLPFEDASSPGGTIVVADGTIIRGACPAAPAPFAVVQHRRRLRSRWDSCGPFTRVRLRLELGPGGRCGYVVGVIRYRDASGRRRALKFPADLAEG
jgi:hypothetical protein